MPLTNDLAKSAETLRLMRLNLVFVGKTAFPEVQSGIDRYLDRLRFYLPAQIYLLKAEKITLKGSEEAIMEKEAERVLKLVDKRDCLLIWDQRGKHMDSVTFARFFDDLRNSGVSPLWMMIGGPLGVSQRLLARADYVLSLSKMTFPHDLARLLVMEQIYRAFTILKGEPYHK
jgi:23S rRNA (pseudouridine1915-N3)-methyltransferase